MLHFGLFENGLVSKM